MNRLFTLVGSTVVVGLVGATPLVFAQSDGLRPGADDRGRRVARAASGHIEGVVVDERGVPLAGAMISALGSTSAVAVSDRRGSFTLRALPPGAYLVRAHLTGFSPSRRQFVEVRPSAPSRFSVTLLRIKAATSPPQMLAAGLATGDDPLSIEPPTGDSAAGDDHSEKAWRLRHLKRSILKETTERAAIDAASDPDTTATTAAAIGRALDSSARFLTDLPITAQVNLLTSGSFDRVPATVTTADNIVRSTAYFSFAGPLWHHGDWSARVMAQPDLGAWFLAAAYHNRGPSPHVYDVGFSYSAQRYDSASERWSPLSGRDALGRSAGSIYGVGRWVFSPRLALDYGARYSRYDYLPGAGLLSPSVSVTVVPVRRVRVYAGLSRRMLAPGAEEFLEPLTVGMWVPPDRTFVGDAPMVAERTGQVELGIESDLVRGLTLAFRSFYQKTSDQQLALFDVGLTSSFDGRHYSVGNAGEVNARGWSIGLSHALTSRFRGSVAYQMTTARWLPMASVDRRGSFLPGFGEEPRQDERLHDLMTAVETDIPLTATRVFIACRINTGFARRDIDALKTGLDSRFDVQVTQRLPFLDFTSAQWQVLVAVKNLFRDPSRDGSVYDELLVVRPPTRIVGGVLVRF
ncbi:MAG TPA: TonB-dependent receptor [Vicinamibacterales bacterium]|jgi:hypothetical protein